MNGAIGEFAIGEWPNESFDASFVGVFTSSVVTSEG